MFHSASLSYHLTSFSEHKSLQHIDHHRAVAESANLWLLPHCKGEYVEGQGILAGAEKPECGATNHLVVTVLLHSYTRVQSREFSY
jgi:hypothetical protein